MIEGAYKKGDNMWVTSAYVNLTRREEFAKAAMQGLLSCGQAHDARTASVTAEESVKIADALLAELDKEEKNNDE